MVELLWSVAFIVGVVLACLYAEHLDKWWKRREAEVEAEQATYTELHTPTPEERFARHFVSAEDMRQALQGDEGETE